MTNSKEYRNDPAKRKEILRQTGVTTGGIPVMDFFSLVETHGLPLDFVIEDLHERGIMPDWCEFMKHAVRCKWNIKRTVHRLHVVVVNVYGTHFAEGWKEKMDQLVGNIV